jgi:TolB protein
MAAIAGLCSAILYGIVMLSPGMLPPDTIAYMSQSRDDMTLYLLDLRTDTTVQLTTYYPNGGISPVWSPDGCKLAYISGAGINITSLDGLRLTDRTLFTMPEARYAVIGEQPDWSPSGDRLLYWLSGGGVYMLNLDGTGYHRITGDWLRARLPDWSPDGERIAFDAAPGGGPSDIFTMRVDGSDLHNVTNHSARDIAPVWSPGGDELAFCSNRTGNYDVYAMDANGANVRQLTFNEALDCNPSWPTDGARIAFASDRGGHFEIYTMRPDGSDVRQITDQPSVENRQPDWRPRSC